MSASKITSLFLPPMDCVKNLILSEAAIERCCTKQELHSSKGCIVAGFQSLFTAAIWTILDAAEFLDPPLPFTYRKTMVTLISMLFLFTEFILVFEPKY